MQNPKISFLLLNIFQYPILISLIIQKKIDLKTNPYLEYKQAVSKKQEWLTSMRTSFTASMTTMPSLGRPIPR